MVVLNDRTNSESVRKDKMKIGAFQGVEEIRIKLNSQFNDKKRN